MLALLPEPRRPAEPECLPTGMAMPQIDLKAAATAAKAHDSALLGWVASRWKAAASSLVGGSLPTAASFAPAAAPGGDDGIRVVASDAVSFEGAALACLERASQPRASLTEGSGDASAKPATALEDDGEVGDGILESSLELRRVGRYRLVLVGNKGHAIGPPLATLKVGPGRAHANTCTVGGDSIDKGFVGQPFDFWLKAYDGAGNVIETDGEKVSVKVTNMPGRMQQAPKVNVRDDGNGTYGLKFVPTVAGIYTLAVVLGKEQVGEAINVTVYRSPTSAANALKQLSVPPLPTGIPAMASARDGDAVKGSARGPNPLSSARRNSTTPRASALSSSPRGGAPVASTPRASSPRPGPSAAPCAEPPMRAPRAQSPRPGAREEKDSAKDSTRDSAKEPSEMDTSPRNVTSFAPAPAPEVTRRLRAGTRERARDVDALLRQRGQSQGQERQQ